MHLRDIVPSNDPIEQSASQYIPVRYDMSLRMTSMETQVVNNLRQLQAKGTFAKQCRICLQTQSSHKKLIKPCKCAGSIEYAHVDCLNQWITRKVQMNSKMKARCQVCGTQFNYRLEMQKQFDCSLLKKHYQKQKRGLICFGVVYGLLFLIFIVSIPMIIASRNIEGFALHSYFTSNQEAVIIAAICLAIYGISLFVVAVLFISEYMVKEVIVVGDLLKYRGSLFLAKSYRICFRK